MMGFLDDWEWKMELWDVFDDEEVGE